MFFAIVKLECGGNPFPKETVVNHIAFVGAIYHFTLR